jgi:hypothetical protein
MLSKEQKGQVMEEVRVHFIGGASIVADGAVADGFWSAWLLYLEKGSPTGFTYETGAGITRSIQFASVSYLQRGKNRS